MKIKNEIRHYRILAISIAILLLVSATSCEYQPTEKFHVKLEEPTGPPPVVFDLNLLTDTIRFYWANDITLKISAGNVRIHSVSFFLDGNDIGTSYYNNTYFRQLDFTQPGTHKFRIEVKTGSGSNSIADGLGAEAFTFTSREWTLIALPTADKPNMSYTLDNTGLTLHWKRYDGPNFVKYRLKELSTGKIYNTDSTDFVNYHYAGEESYYDVYVVDNKDVEYLWGRCFVNKTLPVLRIGSVNNKVALIWNKSIFSENMSECQLFGKISQSEWGLVATLSPQDTAYIIPEAETIFGPLVSFYVYFVPKNYFSITNISSFSSFLNNEYAALSGPYFSDYLRMNCDYICFDQFSSVYQKRILTRYNTSANTSDSVMEYSGWSDISPNGRYYMLAEDSVLKLFDILTGNLVSTGHLRKSYPQYRPWIEPRISDAGISIFGVYDTLYAYDVLNDKPIAIRSMKLESLQLSADGNYMGGIRSDTLFILGITGTSIDSVSCLKIPTGTNAFVRLGFLAAHPDQMYFYSPPDLFIRDCSDMSLIRSFEIGNALYNIDACSDRILTAAGNNIWNILDLNSGNLLASVASGLQGGTGSQEWVFLDGNTIYYPGYRYIVPELSMNK